MAQNAIQTNDNLKIMKGLVNSETMRTRMEGVLGREAGTFLASALDLYTSDKSLSLCDPKRVMAECMKAAALKLPIAKTLGFCYIIPYKNVPQFQMGYKGILQLAQRSGQYKYINADMVYEGETVIYNRITGMMMITGEATSDKPIGYFAYFQLLNGFEKAIYWTKEKVTAHAQRFSKAWKKEDSPWHEHFDAMALKTVLKQLISKFGVMSIEMANVISDDDVADRIDAEVSKNANGAPVTLPDTSDAVVAEFTQSDEPEDEPEEAPASAEPEF